MLIRRDGLAIGQPAHAWVSGQLARAWGNEAFPAPAPREPVCLAAEQHDVGWADADLAPTLDEEGRPRSFVAVPRAEHVAIWRGAARRMLAQSRHAALLVSLHGTSLYDRYVDADAHPPALAAAIRDYLAAERALQAELGAGLDPAVVDRGRRLLLALDGLSLALCHGNAAELGDVPAAGGAGATIRVTPAEAEPRGRGARATTTRSRRTPRPRASPSTRGRSPPGRSPSAARRAGSPVRGPATRRSPRRSPARRGCPCAGCSRRREAATARGQPSEIPSRSRMPSVERGSTPCARR